MAPFGWIAPPGFPYSNNIIQTGSVKKYVNFRLLSRRTGYRGAQVPAPRLPSLPKHRFDLGPGEIPAPDPHLPAVRPDRDGGERCEEYCHLSLGEVVSDDAAPSAECLRLCLRSPFREHDCR